jgi:serine palmitoyltransferase
VLTALTLSRSTVFFFKHNDMTDLRSILASIAEDDVLRKRDSKQQRRFIVVEGLYRNTGNICPLPELVQIKAEFCYRLIVDESLSFGVLGKTGRGVTDHFSLPATAVDILTVAMDTALASVGGVCLGTREIVDHQRLAGAGYCFSASAPPFLSAAALASLDALKTDPGVLGSLASVSKLLCAGVESLQGLERLSSEMSPVVHLVLSTQLDFEEELTVLEAVSKALLHRGVSAAVIKFPEDAIDRLITSGHRPTLRLIAHVGLSSSEITKAIASLQASVNEVIFKSK